VVVHHRSLSYLCNWLGLDVVADLEPKPGVEPSAAYTAQLLKQLQARPAAMVLRTAYQSPRASDWIAGQTGIKAVVLPYTVGGSTRASDLFALFDDSLSRLLDAAR
jgi:zinc/manganese transport system substrate-binding protein